MREELVRVPYIACPACDLRQYQAVSYARRCACPRCEADVLAPRADSSPQHADPADATERCVMASAKAAA